MGYDAILLLLFIRTIEGIRVRLFGTSPVRRLERPWSALSGPGLWCWIIPGAHIQGTILSWKLFLVHVLSTRACPFK